MTRTLLPIVVVVLVARLAPPASGAPNGAELYQRHCAICHGAEGRGVAGAFPPLAGSDYLAREREKSLRAPLEGLFGKITVNGVNYEGAMPPVLLPDDQVAAVLEHVMTSWGNKEKPPTATEISELRAKSKFKTFAALVEAIGTTELPDAPDGWDIKVGVQLTFSPVRMALHPDGKRVLVLHDSGDVWTWTPGQAEAVKLFETGAYIDWEGGRPSVMGMNVDNKGRLYLVCNQRNAKVKPVRNDVTIFRTEAWQAGKEWGKPAAWLKTAYPWGVGPYNHGVNHIAQGPDGRIYVNSGSRTDGGEEGNSADYSKKGEEAITAGMWRLDPEAAKPEIEVIARGLRNSFGFCWDDAGHLMATDNGPDAHSPEEFNLIEAGKHYGFPFQFSDWERKPYKHTPDAPAGVTFTRPFVNVGPDAISGEDDSPGAVKPKTSSTFDAHSSPAGVVYLDKTWPAPLADSFLVARFGNLLARKVDVGFDVLQVKPDFAKRTVTVRKFLSPMSRPIDLVKLPGHKLVVAEFTTGTTLAAGLGTPGRLVVLEPVK